MRVTRYDIGALRSPRVTPQGFLEFDGYASRTGVFEYRDATGGIRRELRLPDEVFAPATMAGFRSAPVTDDHPSEGRVTADNAKQVSVGMVLEPAARDGDMVRVTGTVTDAATIQKMRAGKAQLSVGYEVDLDDTSGVHPEYGRYDAIQRSIRPNHLAIVSTGRAGPEARVRMDGWSGADLACGAAAATFQENPMDKPETKPLILEAAAQLAVATARADAAEAKLAGETARADAATGRADIAEKKIATMSENRIDQSDLDKRDAQLKAMQVKLDEAITARVAAEDPARLQKAVNRRVKVERHARSVLPGRDTFDGLTDRELQLAVIEKLQGPIESDRSDEYVQAAFDMAVKGYDAGERALERIAQAAAPTVPQPGERKDAASARARMIAEQDNAWKTPVGLTAAPK